MYVCVPLRPLPSFLPWQRCYGVLAKATLLNCRGRSSEAIQAMQGACDSIAGYLTTREPLPGPGWQS
jgi:hypothetical protein